MAVPLSANAAGSILVVSMGSPSTETGLLTLGLSATTGVVPTSITAHIYSGSTHELDVTGFQLLSGTAENGEWQLTTPITTTALPLGTYTVTVDATDTGGDTIAGAAAPGVYSFLIGPEITVAATPAALSFDHQAYALSGTLLGAAPSGTTSPLAGVNLYAQATKSNTPVGSPVLVGTSTATGSFSGTFQPALVAGNGSPDGYYLETDANSTTLAGQSTSQPITVNTDALTIKASLSSSKIKYGQAVTMTGVVDYTEGTTTAAAAGQTVNITGGTGATNSVTVTTSATGTFSTALPQSLSTTWQVQAGGSALTPWFDYTTTNVTMAVAVPVSVQYFKASLSSAGVLSYNVCLSAASQVTAFGPFGYVEIQYAKGSHGPWKNLARGTLAENTAQGTPCYESFTGPNGLGNATGTVKAKLVNAWYRAVYGGNSYDQPVTSHVVHAWLSLTRITGFNVSPRSIGSGGRVTVTGKLQKQHGRGWVAYARRAVGIFWENSSQGVNFVGAVKTSRTGAFRVSIRFTGSGSAKMFAFYPGDKTHLYSISVLVKFTVGQAVRQPQVSAAQLGALAGMRSMESELLALTRAG